MYMLLALNAAQSRVSTAPSDSTNAGEGFTAKPHSFQLLQQYSAGQRGTPEHIS